jgi:hypothetical protein
MTLFEQPPISAAIYMTMFRDFKIKMKATKTYGL